MQCRCSAAIYVNFSHHLCSHRPLRNSLHRVSLAVLRGRPGAASAESCTHPARRDRCFPPSIAERQRLPNAGIYIKWFVFIKFVAVSVCGRFGLWPFWFVAVSVCGPFGFWPFRFVAVSVCGLFDLWSFRVMAISVLAFRFVVAMTRNHCLCCYKCKRTQIKWNEKIFIQTHCVCTILIQCCFDTIAIPQITLWSVIKHV